MPKSLQDEIRQTKPFARPTSEAILSVLRTANVLEHEHNEALRPYGITLTQYNVLRILKGAGRDGLCGREVGERLISKVPDVSRLLVRMEEMGLVSRKRDTVDLRHVTARITAEGRRLLVETTPELESIAHVRVDRLSPATLKVLISALATVRESP